MDTDISPAGDRPDADPLPEDRPAHGQSAAASPYLLPFAASRDGLVVCEKSGIVAFLNESAEGLLGLDARLVLGRPLDSIMHLARSDGTPVGWERLAAAARETKAQTDRESLWLARQDGSELSVRYETVAMDSLIALVLIPPRETWDNPAILAYRASHDPLTGLPNRAALKERLDLLHRAALTMGGTYGMLLVDLDHFKVVNDRFGHATGDRVLIQVGRRILRHVRSHDTVGRWGGEEILCLLPQVDRKQAAEVAERVRTGIEARPVEHDGRLVRVTASIGVTAFPEDAKDTDTLLAKADLALYEAKRAGRNRVRCHTGASGGVFAIAKLVEQALRENRLVPVYQPIVDLKSGERRGEEALARILLPDGGALEAAAFIPAAEQLNLVHRVDRRIIGLAARRCLAPGHAIERHSLTLVNFSADFLRHPDLVAEILDALRRDLPAEAARRGKKVPLVVEIAERQFLQDIAEAQQVLAPFVELGLRLAIDDFGSGHSSLAYLADLPIELLKIERALIRRVAAEKRVRELIRGIQSLADELGVVTVAEGIEDEATLELLRDIGIDWGQGFRLSRPGPDPKPG